MATKNKTWYNAKTETNVSGEKIGKIEVFDEIGLWGIGFPQFQGAVKDLGDVSEYELHLHSPGGAVFDAIAMANFLKGQGKRITAKIVGYCASAATILSSVCDRVEMASNAFFLIHKPWTWAAGNSDEMRDVADNLDRIEGGIVQTYVGKCGKDEAQIKGWMEENVWWTAAQAKENGFVDEVTAEMKLCARADLEKLGGVLPACMAEEPEKPKDSLLDKILNVCGLADAKDLIEARKDFDAEMRVFKGEKEAFAALQTELEGYRAAAAEMEKARADLAADKQKWAAEKAAAISAGVVDQVAALGIKEPELPSGTGTDGPGNMSMEELLALINGADTPDAERWAAYREMGKRRGEKGEF